MEDLSFRVNNTSGTSFAMKLSLWFIVMSEIFVGILSRQMKKVPFLSLILLFLVSILAAQSTPQKKPPQPPAAQADQEQKEPQHKVTPEEAKELFQSVDEVLRFASKSSLLPMKHPVKKAMVSREQVEKYIDDKLKNDIDSIRLK